MSNKKTALILFLLGIVSLITGFILMFISSVKEDQEEMNKRAVEITTKYKKFKAELIKVNDERDLLHKEVLDTIYYESFEKNDTSYKNRLLTYEENITNLSKSYKKMKEYCNSGIYYASSDANSKCVAFNLSYEQMINTFVDDISMYNSNIDKYNKWLDEQGTTTSLKLQKYETKKTYIDFNKDGEYSGKEEEEANEQQ